ncbi:hypothetical protein [Streptosporangium carneum]|uniref:Uncharacterized protein n=1 Tax=Streptosporangium carneum TaxID=47481 RepID=A0A9W6I7N7_9ACTN|nr:hypothetical protein [Streptosporangium carneum]GLK13605.1 hypothetical protein GCM10017600_70160 [Streptosporangium carneum]
MTQDRYVTSTAIQSIRTELDDDVIPKIGELRGLIDSTDVPFPGWGGVGELAIGLRYRQVQEDAREKLSQALDVLESWQEALNTAAVNWRTAEYNSTVVYQ